MGVALWEKKLFFFFGIGSDFVRRHSRRTVAVRHLSIVPPPPPPAAAILARPTPALRAWATGAGRLADGATGSRLEEGIITVTNIRGRRRSSKSTQREVSKKAVSISDIPATPITPQFIGWPRSPDRPCFVACPGGMVGQPRARETWDTPPIQVIWPVGNSRWRNATGARRGAGREGGNARYPVGKGGLLTNSSRGIDRPSGEH